MLKKQFLLILMLSACFVTYGQTLPSFVSTKNLVAYYPLDSNALDLSNNALNGNNFNATVAFDRKGLPNKAMYFSGNANIAIPYNSLLDLSNQFTISAWVARTSNTPMRIIDKTSVGVSNSWCVDLNPFGNAPGQVRLIVAGIVPNPDFPITPASVLPAGNWAHLAITYDRTMVKFYVNGTVVATKAVTTPTPSNTNPVFIGSSTGNTNNFIGYLDEIGIWSRALTQKEVLNLYLECKDSLTANPTDTAMFEGETATFIAKSSSIGATYQWQSDIGFGYTNLSNAGVFSGVNDDTLTVKNLTLANNMQKFRCVVNAGGCIDTSTIATLTVSSKTGIHHLYADHLLKVYPNPAQHSFQLYTNILQLQTPYRLIDVFGRTVMQGFMQGKVTEVQIENLSKGVYFIVFDNNAFGTRRIVKQ